MFGSYYIINLVLAVVASSYEKESKIKEKKKKENSDTLELWKRKEEMVGRTMTYIFIFLC